MKMRSKGFRKGVGKNKYKHGSVAKNATGGVTNFSPGVRETDLDDLDPSKADVMSPDYWKKMGARVPALKQKELAPVLQQIQNYTEVLSRKEEIESALSVLDKHDAAYKALTRDPEKWLQINDSLFGEKSFQDMRFHADDLQRAFEVVGYPSPNMMDERNADNMAKAVHFLISNEEREALAYKILLLLPQYVKEGRYMEGFILQQNADILMEPPQDTLGGLLIAMFMRGLADWESSREQERESLFKELGLTQEELERIGIEGLEGWLNSIADDPKKKAALERCLAQNPELAGMAASQCRDSEGKALELLRREEAEALDLTPRELQPWFVVLEKRLTEAPENFPALLKKGEMSEAAIEALDEIFYKISSEMVSAIFTSKRLKKLTAQLQKLHRMFESEDDQLGIEQVDGALMSIHLKSAEGENRFLLSLCYNSLRRQLQ
jgi:hypothetical protein